ncbi:MAG: RNA polymerase sigma factor, partial [Phycisphaerales bacterium]|nr:RNA polymerase sigma factor [Phycisphaerales bacterium]
IRLDGGPAAWREFFRRYGPMLLGFARRSGFSEADSQDVVQEVLLAVHKAFTQMESPFDRTRGKFKSWLRGVARHKVQDMRRRRARQAVTEREASLMIDQALLDRDFEFEWRRALLIDCLVETSRQIDPAVYQAFELYAIRGESPAAVAKLLGISRNAVYISKSRVLKTARQVLARRLAEEG